MEIKPLKIYRRFWRSIPQQHFVSAILLLTVIGTQVVPASSPFFANRLSVLKRPRSPLAHLNLSRTSALSSDWFLAAHEFAFALQLVSAADSDRIAGLSSDFDEIKPFVFRRRFLMEDTRRWEEIVQTQPGYRDGHLHLALNYFQLAQQDIALAHWQSARELDPNNEEVAAVGFLLGENTP
ncbi:MAG: hypothetical protein A2785_03600 [Candidatus Chisholmbacteria bacterium RIFCSPHIGHO2_01_FULL_49_18]|uniref:Uncharacterized protein n=2 Tax=Candidatus Chisholmiibacteriota TaxID=1817900 RepID=A0A1G1VNA5_9BACT|nr:MAG: hypothetical protein A2785_03600 [Candidatus Chisholmbacteria bacterium RIFCSPHIGHO2_01_FULL_49_18]OGY19483.1 MAG: hypothetical protein A3A65_06260 [Candidatus Chisholmbacteria bacterium RIFCSPLOWO2_01_FULL_49_14]